MTSATRSISRVRKGKAFWEDQFSQWQQSGLSKAAYCRNHDMSKSTFDNWFRKLQQPRQKSKQPRDFLSLRLQEDVPKTSKLAPAASPTGTIEIQLRHDLVVKVHSPIDPDALYQVLHLLRQFP